MAEVEVSVGGFQDSDARERAELARGLRTELLRLDVADVQHAERDAPENAKGLSVEWAEMIVHGVTAIPAVVAMVSAWRERHRGPTVSLTIDGDSITLEGATDVERRELLAQWMARHAD